MWKNVEKYEMRKVIDMVIDRFETIKQRRKPS
jgi:hypothetical protein